MSELIHLGGNQYVTDDEAGYRHMSHIDQQAQSGEIVVNGELMQSDEPDGFSFGEADSFDEYDALIPPRLFEDDESKEGNEPGGHFFDNSVDSLFGSQSSISANQDDELPDHLKPILESPRRRINRNEEVTVNYVGAGGGPIGGYQHTEQFGDGDMLVAPVINWAEKAKLPQKSGCECSHDPNAPLIAPSIGW
jgi:hypothetical protein